MICTAWWQIRSPTRTAQSGRQLEQLYTQALPLAVRLMTEYAADEPLDPAYQHTFGED